MSISTGTTPETVELIDWIVIVRILSQIGIVDLDGDHSALVGYSDLWEYNADESGRISELSVSHLGGIHPYELPTDISRLQMLSSLSIRDCKSISSKIRNLSQVFYLSFDKSSQLLNESFPEYLKVPNLTDLFIHRCTIQRPSPFLNWFAQQLPKLTAFGLFRVERSTSIHVLDLVCSVRPYCRMVSLSMERCELCEKELGQILVQLRNMRNIKYIYLGNNNIESVRTIVDFIHQSKTSFVVSNSIQTLDLSDNPIMNIIKESPTERMAFLSFLKTFKTINTLGYHITREPYDSDIKYALRINHAGRILIEDDGSNSNSNNSNININGNGNDGSSNFVPLPLSMWPLVLERSCAQSPDGSATGLFYLLRNGPALADRIDFGGKRRKFTPVVVALGSKLEPFTQKRKVPG